MLSDEFICNGKWNGVKCTHQFAYEELSAKCMHEFKHFCKCSKGLKTTKDYVLHRNPCDSEKFHHHSRGLCFEEKKSRQGIIDPSCYNYSNERSGGKDDKNQPDEYEDDDNNQTDNEDYGNDSKYYDDK